MDAEPSILCNNTGAHGRMRAVAAVTMLLYVLGVPAAFAAFLAARRVQVRSDQLLRQRGEGDRCVEAPAVTREGRGCARRGTGGACGRVAVVSCVFVSLSDVPCASVLRWRLCVRVRPWFSSLTNPHVHLRRR
jgi:hypothetical protein